MAISVRGILLALAVVLFLIAWLSDDNYADLLALGLASFAAAFLVDALGLDRAVAGTRTGTTTRDV